MLHDIALYKLNIDIDIDYQYIRALYVAQFFKHFFTSARQRYTFLSKRLIKG